MDWEKKTTARAPLRDAAGNPLNDLITPGQALLNSLQAAEIVRKDHFYNTVDAKMKAAREKLPALLVKNPPRSDTTIFGRPDAEVHGLQPNARPQQAKMEGVRTMLEIKMEEHEAAWREFVGVRDGAAAQLDREIVHAVEDLKVKIDENDAEMELELSALADESLMRMDLPDVDQIWNIIETAIPVRAGWIDGLAGALEVAEEGRRVAVEAALVQMLSDLNAVAHVSEGEVERMLERESLALNLAILENRRAYADLVKRLQIQEVDLEQARRTLWESGLGRWRSLRTRHAMNLFNERIRSSEFAEPSERLAATSELRDRQQAVLAAHLTHWQAVAALMPPHLSSGHCKA